MKSLICCIFIQRSIWALPYKNCARHASSDVCKGHPSIALNLFLYVILFYTDDFGLKLLNPSKTLFNA